MIWLVRVKKFIYTDWNIIRVSVGRKVRHRYNTYKPNSIIEGAICSTLTLVIVTLVVVVIVTLVDVRIGVIGGVNVCTIECTYVSVLFDTADRVCVAVSMVGLDLEIWPFNGNDSGW